MKTGTKIKSVKYAGDYKLTIKFNDGHVNTIDYKNLVTCDHEEFKPYLDVTKFKKFKVDKCNTAVVWGKNWEMILPLSDLYSKKTVRFMQHEN